MYVVTKLKRYKRIKRCIILAVTLSIYLSLVAVSKHVFFRNRFWCGSTTSFVVGKSSYNVGDSIVVSNILQRHRTYYNNRLPHNRYLYDILQVPSNATIQQIQQSYRTLSRIYHPDKRNSRKTNTPQRRHESENDEILLQRIRSAYDLLKNDTKRFLYHRHGIIHSTQVDIMSILYPVHYSRQQSSLSSSSLFYDPSIIEEVHRWMGYDSNRGEFMQGKHSSLFTNSDKEDDSDENQKEARIQNIMLLLIERIRPIIENLSSASSNAYEQYMYQELIEHCDRIKVLPLGPSILRCIGRAYRYEGQRVARQFKLQILPRNTHMNGINNSPDHETNRQYQPQHHQEQQQKQQIVTIQRRPISQYLFVLDRMRHTMRHVKHLTNAAIAGSRVYLQERHHNKNRQRELERDENKLAEWNDNDMDFDNELLFGGPDDITTDNEIEQQSATTDSGFPTDQVVLESLQIDALWKVYKIELDSIVRTACRRILLSLQDPYHNVFLPSHVSEATYDDPYSHQSPYKSFVNSQTSRNYDGWIVSDRSKIDGTTSPILSNSMIRQQQQQLVAKVFVRMGSILIERSKVDTSWMA